MLARNLLLITLCGLLLALLPTAVASAADDPRLVVYPGRGATVHRASHELDELRRTSPAFQRLVKSRLDRIFRDMGGASKCRQAPEVTIKRWRSDGFATGSEFYGAPCNGGGHWVLYARPGGPGTDWRLVLAGQDLAWCTDVSHFGFPARFLPGGCYSDLEEVVDYAPSIQAEPTADYAAATLIANVNAPHQFGAIRFAKEALVYELVADVDEGATVTGGRCFGADDPEYGDVLGTTPAGCLVDVYFEAESYRKIGVLRMHPARWGRWQARSIEWVASS